MVKICLCLFAIAIVGAMAITQEERTEMLNRHTELRNALLAGTVAGQPRARSMSTLVWDSGLEATAQKMADRCSLGYESPEDRIPAGQANNQLYRDISQNVLFVPSTTPLVDVAQQWWNEHTAFNYDSRHCTGGRPCMTYVNMAWAATTRVGCAYKNCEEKLVVCNYALGRSKATKNSAPYDKA
ncbi:hypothetical protein Ciccas_005749 [Cichlidogyrus casuarinus]|uniref:SCP domain-containing protein n=1 Tax=Cichlidogyrus casuarinus TaxID=1844966 RepID=A0ABD2Q7R9_9PLAT